MKKLLSLLGAIGLTATTGATVVACGQTSTKTNVANDVVTQQDFSVATQNLQTEEAYAEGDLIACLDNNVRGYLNPLFLNLIGQNVSDIDEDYEIQGITEEAIEKAVQEVNAGAEKAQLTGLTVHTKDNAQYLAGDVELPPITVLLGSDLKEVIEEIDHEITVESEDYLPTFEEILKKINDEIYEATGELEMLKLGNFSFNIDRGYINVIGNGVYYGQFSVKLDSQMATDIASIITPDENNLGNLGFINTPTNDQLFNTLVAKFGADYNTDNLEIISNSDKSAQLIGRNKLKGQATVTYTRTTFDLANITTKNLGALEDAPTNKAELVAKINEVNQGLGLTEDLITIAGQINPLGATISAIEGGDIVTGVAQIQWSIKQYDLNELVGETDLGSLAISASHQDIVDRINEINGTDFVLGRDVEINGIEGVGEEGRTAMLVAVADNPKYTGSIKVNWKIIADLTTKNIEEAINGLGQLRFEIKAGTTSADAKTEVTARIKELLERKYAVPNTFAVTYSEFPDDELLGTPTSPNMPWRATDEAQMSFIVDKDTPVVVNVVWMIDVIA